MNRDEELITTLEQIKMLAHIALAVDSDAVQQLLAEINRTDTLAAILDPTWFQKNMNNVADHKELVMAFVTFRKSLRKFEHESRV